MSSLISLIFSPKYIADCGSPSAVKNAARRSYAQNAVGKSPRRRDVSDTPKSRDNDTRTSLEYVRDRVGTRDVVSSATSPLLTTALSAVLVFVWAVFSLESNE